MQILGNFVFLILYQIVYTIIYEPPFVKIWNLIFFNIGEGFTMNKSY